MICTVTLVIGPILWAAFYTGEPVPTYDALHTRAVNYAVENRCDFINGPSLDWSGGRRLVRMDITETNIDVTVVPMRMVK